MADSLRSWATKREASPNWYYKRCLTFPAWKSDVCCLVDISGGEMKKLAEAAGIDLGSVVVEILDEED